MKIGDKLTQEEFKALDLETEIKASKVVSVNNDRHEFELTTVEDMEVIVKPCVANNNYEEHYVDCILAGGEKAQCKAQTIEKIADRIEEIRKAEVEDLENTQRVSHAEGLSLVLTDKDLK